jgi:hypothetical protein
MSMRRLLLAIVLFTMPLALRAQQPDSGLDGRALPRDVAREAVRLYNADATLRVAGALDVQAAREITGDVAVLDGPVQVAGHVTGTLLAINGNVTLAPSARIDGNLLVVGGTVIGQNAGYVGGEIRIYRDPLRYTRSGDRIRATEQGIDEEPWWRRVEHEQDWSGTRLHVASAGAYNRVEGLPINLGPQMERDFDGWTARLDAYAVLRTASSFRSTDNDVGHNLRTEIRLGGRRGVLLGAGAYDLVTPVEAWGLSNLETGLTSGLFRRDYRDWYNRQGGSLEAGFFVGPDATLKASYASEHWSPRAAANAWSLFRSDAAWRPNPTLDDARAHLARLALNIDTRSDEANPWAGWYVAGEFEHGWVRFDSLAGTGVVRSYPATDAAQYNRLFVDLRRYNRVSRNVQLNLRVVAGGWLGGDALPTERRLSVDGYDALPGFGFRRPVSGLDVSTCAFGAVPAGMPAQCDRIALAQAEYRSALHLHLFDWDNDDWVRPHLNANGAWVLFLDAGRGWMTGPGSGSGPVRYGRWTLPDPSTFHTDIGFGLDFDNVGVYVAKALSEAGLPARVFIRLQHRF